MCRYFRWDNLHRWFRSKSASGERVPSTVGIKIQVSKMCRLINRELTCYGTQLIFGQILCTAESITGNAVCRRGDNHKAF